MKHIWRAVCAAGGGVVQEVFRVEIRRCFQHVFGDFECTGDAYHVMALWRRFAHVLHPKRPGDVHMKGEQPAAEFSEQVRRVRDFIEEIARRVGGICRRPPNISLQNSVLSGAERTMAGANRES